MFKELKLSDTGVCEVTGPEQSSLLRIDASSQVRLAKSTVTIQTGTCHVIVEYDDVTNARLDYDRVADFIAGCIDDNLPRGRRYRGLREVDFILLNEACMPVRGTEGSAGYDCKVDQEALKGNAQIRVLDNILTLEPGQFFLAPLGFKLHIDDPEFEAQLRPRSGKGSKGLVLGNMIGTMDSDYQGQYMACLWNRLSTPLEVDLDQPVCQMVFNRVEHPHFDPVEEFRPTDRGDGGFGSTDKKAGA